MTHACRPVCGFRYKQRQPQGRSDRTLKYLLIAIGGALGSIARYWVSVTVAGRMGTRFPYGTFVVNLSACLLMGFAVTWIGRRAGIGREWMYLVPIGFIGAYSTVSTDEWETLSSLRAGMFFLAGLYAFGSLFVGLAAVWCGARLAETLS
jgi:fluoride exporter